MHVQVRRWETIGVVLIQRLSPALLMTFASRRDYAMSGRFQRFSLISLRLGEGRLTSGQQSLSNPHGNSLPPVFADCLRRQLPWPILPQRALERLCRVEREWFRRYRFGETAGGRNNDGYP